jgi:RNA recognition motif-containing protein
MGAQINRSRGARCSLNFVHLNFVLLPNCPTRAHNQKATGRGNVVKNLFVGNLGSEVSHEELRRLFEAYGGVEQVHVIVDRDTGLPRRFAFVEMTNDTEALKAIKGLNGSILRDRALDVNYARPRPERPAA